MNGHVLRLEDNFTAGGEARGDQILDDFVLGVDGDGFSAGEAAQVDAMAAPVEAEFDTVMEEGLALEAFADTRFDHQVDGALFEEAGAQPRFDIFAGANFEDDRLDALQVEEMREHQAGRPSPDDSDLRTSHCDATVSILHGNVDAR